jgi:hypothetical protein
VRAYLFVGALAEHFAHRLAVQLAARAPEPAVVGAVVEAVSLLGIDVCDGDGDGVEDEAQTLFVGGRVRVARVRLRAVRAGCF